MADRRTGSPLTSFASSMDFWSSTGMLFRTKRHVRSRRAGFRCSAIASVPWGCWQVLGFNERQETLMSDAINVNGMSRRVDVDPDTPVLWILRDVLGMTGTKF